MPDDVLPLSIGQWQRAAGAAATLGSTSDREAPPPPGRLTN